MFYQVKRGTYLDDNLDTDSWETVETLYYSDWVNAVTSSIDDAEIEAVGDEYNREHLNPQDVITEDIAISEIAKLRQTVKESGSFAEWFEAQFDRKIGAVVSIDEDFGTFVALRGPNSTYIFEVTQMEEIVVIGSKRMKLVEQVDE